MLKLLRSSKNMANLSNLNSSQCNSPKRTADYFARSSLLMDMVLDKGNLIYSDNRPFQQKDFSMLQSNLHKDNLNNYVFQGQHPLTLNESNPNTVEVAVSTESKANLRPRQLWKKSVDTIKQNQGLINENEIEEPKLPCQNKNFLPENGHFSDASDTSSKTIFQVDTESNGKSQRSKDILKKRSISKYPRDCSEFELSYLKSKQSSARDKIYTINGDKEPNVLKEQPQYDENTSAQKKGDYPEVYQDHNDSYKKLKSFVHINRASLQNEESLPNRDIQYKLFNKLCSLKENNPSMTEVKERYRQNLTHCRSCLSNVPSYTGHYLSRSPYKCDDSLHIGNLYGIDEDRMLHETAKSNHSEDAFEHDWVENNAQQFQKNKLRINRQHSCDNINKPREIEVGRSSHGISLKDKELYLQESTFSNLLIVPSETLLGNKNPLYTHSLKETKHSSSVYPDISSATPFLHSNQENKNHGPNSSDIYKQSTSFKVRSDNCLRSSIKSNTSYSSREGWVPNDIGVSQYVMPYNLSKNSMCPPPRVVNSYSNRHVLKKMPSIESDV